MLGNQIIATDVTYDEFLEHYAGQPIEWVENNKPTYEIAISEDEILATDVSYADFLAKFDGQHVEWFDGTVIKMPPVTDKHNELTTFLIVLFETYLSLAGGGETRHAPMILHPAPHLPARQPDIQIILPENLHIIKATEIAGAADLVVEVAAPDTHRRDHIEKFREYEQAGIREYWVIEYGRKQADFHVLNKQRQYNFLSADENGVYHSTVLDKLKIAVEIFWRDKLPDGVETFRMVEALFKEGSE